MHEAVALVEGLLGDPEDSVGVEQLSVKTVSDSASVLDIADHVLHGFPGVVLVEVLALGHVLLDEGEGSLKVREVELIRYAESKRSELSSLLDDGVHEADGVDDGPPLLVWLDLLEEVLVDHCGEGSVETGLDSLWWLDGALDGHLEETQWEVLVWLTRDPESEVWVDGSVLWMQDFLKLSHVLETQVAVGQDDPLTLLHVLVDILLSLNLLLLTHRYLVWVLLLLLGELSDGSSWISTSRKQVEDRNVRRGLGVGVLDKISDWSDVLVTKDLPDEHVGSQEGSVLSHAADEAEMDEATDVLVSSDLLLVVGDPLVLWVVELDPLSPFGVVPLDSVWELLEELQVLSVEAVLGQGLEVEPGLVLHPVEELVSVVDTSTSFEEHADVAWLQLTILDQDLGAHHDLEGDLVPFEETSADVPVDSHGELLLDVLDSLLLEFVLWSVLNCAVEQTEELAKGGIVHPVDHDHLHDAEVQHGTSGSSWSEVLSLVVDFDSLLLGLLEFLVDLLGFGLDGPEADPRETSAVWCWK